MATDRNSRSNGTNRSSKSSSGKLRRTQEDDIILTDEEKELIAQARREAARKNRAAGASNNRTSGNSTNRNSGKKKSSTKRATDEMGFEEETTPKRSKKNSKKAKKKKRRKWILAIEAILLVVVIVLLYFWSKVDQINHTNLENVEVNELDEKTQELLKGYQTIALYGLDNRTAGTYSSGRSDTIMVAAINNDTKEVKIMSVFRDTLLDVDGEGTLKKCNSGYNGGPEESINMLNRNLDLDISDYITVDFAALAQVVEAVGGVEIDVDDEEMFWINEYYLRETQEFCGMESDKVANTGLVTLNGVQAVCYARIRYTSGGDFERASRQREVLSQIIEKAKTANLSTLNKIIDAVFPNIDTSFTLSELISLAAAYSDYTLGETSGFPFDKATATYDSVGSVDVPCTLLSNVVQAHEFLYGDDEYTPSTTVQEISDSIINFTGMTAEDALDYGF